ncbi:DUF2071 domain-containing protein [Chryseobacterium sp.]|uniref:DUF2071 domain-containing protein n=1 Tax=Chryseobacterium sp. TaxID=1871047 RepID=UPI00388E0D6E
MKIPTMHGIIERRILVNYTADPTVVQSLLPFPFRPKIYKGKSIVGICLIRLKDIKPKGFPSVVGVNSENAAHRIAVEWDENGITKEGVFIPRRDTNLWLNSLVGGRIFPGKHYYAKFEVEESSTDYHLAYTSSDSTTLELDAKLSSDFNKNSMFGSLENVSNFFENGSVGYSSNGNCFEGLQLNAYSWEVQPLEIHRIKSSFFENTSVFPEGSIQLDNAILMQNIEHEWSALPEIMGE